ncbi:ABC transporter permease [candidate division KSB1 bacterium]
MTRKKENPPRLAQWIVRRMSLYNVRHSMNGDIEELYNEMLREKGYAAAGLWYRLQTLLTVVMYGKFTLYWSIVMIKNYLTITFRTLLKYKSFSFINIFGLALSMSVCLMIIVFVKDHKSSDQFHEKKDRIFRVYTTDANHGWDIDGWAVSSGYLAPYLLDNYAFIEDAVRLRQMGAYVLKTETNVYIGGLYADPSFFNIFTYPLKEGDPETALDNPFSIVLSEETAYKFFGSEDPMHKTMTLENLGDFTVTGVLRDMDVKSHFSFDILVSFETVASLENSGVYDTDMNSWESFSRYYTYVLLEEEDHQSLFEEQLPHIANTIIPEEERERFGFKIQPLLSISLGKNLTNKMPGTKVRLDIMFIPFLAILVIFLACFNYIILSIARSLKRTKEIGLRKVIGAKRGEIIKLFLSETFTVTFLALITACLIILWLIPAFNSVDAIENTENQINIEMMKDPGLYLYFLLFALGVSVLAGLYPALYLSSFLPVNALQGLKRIKGFSHLLTRKILMAIQFTVSLVSIIFIVYFYQMYAYWMDFDREIATENVVSVYLRDVNHETFRNELMTNSNVAGVSLSDRAPVYGGGGYIGLRTEEMEEPRSAYYYSVDPEFIPNFKLQIIAGRNFSHEYPTDAENAIILNEKAVPFYNLGTPGESLGKTLFFDSDKEYTVVGVVKDFYYRKYMENQLEPLALFFPPNELRYANIHYMPGTKDAIKESLPAIWKKFDEVHPVSTRYFDEEQEEINNTIGGTIAISAWGCGFVILIALFGLLGMATYTSEMRIKEVGIRKVLGASVSGTTFLLSKDYLKLILYSAAVALPGGYYLSDLIFQFFANRPELSLWVPFGALLFILALALISIGSQTIKAALADPVETLREE